MLMTHKSFSVGQCKEEIKFDKILGYRNGNPLKRGINFLNFWTVWLRLRCYSCPDLFRFFYLLQNRRLPKKSRMQSLRKKIGVWGSHGDLFYSGFGICFILCRWMVLFEIFGTNKSLQNWTFVFVLYIQRTLIKLLKLCTFMCVSFCFFFQN